MKIGYFLSCEENDPRALIAQAKQAHEAGFHALWISDHYHPWNDEQGHSAFVWSVIGALAEATPLPVTTGVTCPTMRIHPAVIAQAAATSGVLHEGRFSLGVGSGEALNEHILGEHWPEADVRLEMLEEAVEVMRHLWQGGQRSHRGRHYTVENARVYDLPQERVSVLVSGFGPKAISLAAKIGDGYVTMAPDADAIAQYRSEGGRGPVHSGTKVCYMASEEQARETVMRLWPNEALPGELAQILPTPTHFEQAAGLVRPEDLSTPMGPDVEAQIEARREYETAGIDELYVQQVGPEKDAFVAEWAPRVVRAFLD